MEVNSMKKVKYTYEFQKLDCCLELLAIKDIIADKKKLLKHKIFKCYSSKYSEEEFYKCIECIEELKEFIKRMELFREKNYDEVYYLTGLSYNEAIKFAEENKENNIRLYNLHYANYHSYIVYSLRGKLEEYSDIAKKVYIKEFHEISKPFIIKKSKFWDIW